ncbi:hypothetical protein KXW21_005077 [Aspergillus fumigatus]|nr:hypothetical protein KXW21_005077 [Aspergillus fumigatus]
MAQNISGVDETSQNDRFVCETFQQRHVAYLQHILRLSAFNNGRAYPCILAEIERQSTQALQIERNLRAKDLMTIDRQSQQLLDCQEAKSATERDLHLERERLEDTAAELDRTQRKFQLVDSLVDAMLLEEDSYLELPDRARQITDVILDLEKQLEAKYRAMLDEKDELIAKLNQHVSKADLREAGRRRAQSETTFLP